MLFGFPSLQLRVVALYCGNQGRNYKVLLGCSPAVLVIIAHVVYSLAFPKGQWFFIIINISSSAFASNFRLISRSSDFFSFHISSNSLRKMIIILIPPWKRANQYQRKITGHWNRYPYASDWLIIGCH